MGGFLTNNVSIYLNRDNFLSHHTQILMVRHDKQEVRAYESNMGYDINAVRSTLGEFFEREVLINTNEIRKQFFNAISLLDGTVRKVEASKVVFQNEFIDSCGMASHYVSNNVIRTAFLEFLERQSFIYSFLSKNVGKKILIDLENYYGEEKSKEVFNEIKKYDKYLKQFIDEINYYNISLIDNVYVVLAISYGKKNKGIGLGTDISPYKAVLKAQKEILQNFATYVTKYEYSSDGFYEDSPSERDLYFYRFYNLSVDELRRAYNYLEKSEKVRINNLVKDRAFSISQLVKEINERYKMEPYIVCIPSKREITNLKIVKIFDFNWFPHMNPAYYDKEIYHFMEKITGVELNKQELYIPFP